MEVILRDHVEHVGKRGEVVKVADGYARNFLLPRKLALPATPGNRKHIERERVKLDAQEAHEKTAAEAVAARMANVEAVITRKVGDTDALFGSVTSADIAEALGKLGFETDKRKLGPARADQEAGHVHRAVEAPPRSDREHPGPGAGRRAAGRESGSPKAEAPVAKVEESAKEE